MCGEINFREVRSEEFSDLLITRYLCRHSGMMKRPMLLFALLLLLNGCKPATTEISGQAFVVLENHQTIKLSMLPIYVLEPSEVQTRIAAEKEESAKQITKLNAEITLLQSKADSLKITIEEQKKLMNDWLEKSHSYSKAALHSATQETNNVKYEGEMSALAKQSIEKADELHILWANSDRELEQVQNQIKNKSDEIKHWSGPKMIMKTPWKGEIAKSMTDADGNFKISIPKRGTFSLVACTDWKSADSVETYCWLVPITNSGTVFLNNQNLIQDGAWGK
jgi:hypothetical protein